MRETMELFKEFSIEAAHYLPHVAEEHKCKRLHGHSFRVQVTVSGPVDQRLGWVMDFAEISHAFDPIMQALDHRCLNDVKGLENPTSENLSKWIWDRLNPSLPGLKRVVVRETCSSGCSYEGQRVSKT